MPESALNLLRMPNEQTRSYPEHSCIPVKGTGQGQPRETRMAVGNTESMLEERVARDRAVDAEGSGRWHWRGAPGEQPNKGMEEQVVDREESHAKR